MTDSSDERRIYNGMEILINKNNYTFEWISPDVLKWIRCFALQYLFIDSFVFEKSNSQ